MTDAGLQLNIQLEGVPPSVNKAYINMSRGRTLSTLGRLYHADVVNRVTLSVLNGDLLRMDPDQPHLLWVRVHLPIYTKPGGEAKSRYKKLDASNRIKLLEDAVCHALGIDDSCFEAVLIQKVHALPGQERTEVKIYNLQKADKSCVGRLFAESLQSDGATATMPLLKDPVLPGVDERSTPPRAGKRSRR